MALIRKFIGLFAVLPALAQLAAAQNEKVDTTLSRPYFKARKSISGKLNTIEYTALRREITHVLHCEIPGDKTILINYNHRAKNCLMFGFSKSEFSQIIDNLVRISTRLSATHNVWDFFIFSGDAFHIAMFRANKRFMPNPGFFHDSIFTLHESCQAFFILKPSGRFLKYYGEDYFSVVEAFLESDRP